MMPFADIVELAAWKREAHLIGRGSEMNATNHSLGRSVGIVEIHGHGSHKFRDFRDFQ